MVEIDTNLGAIRVQLDAVNAPGTVRNFLNYVGDGFYDDTLFHYVAPDKMIVGGGFRRRRAAQSGWQPRSGTKLTTASRTCAARSPWPATRRRESTARPRSFSSIWSTRPSFDHRGEEADEYGYCVFGEVVDGLDVAEAISHAPTRDGGGDLAQTPDPPVVIKSIRVVE